MDKANIFEVENVIRTFKVIITSLITALVISIPTFIGFYSKVKGLLFVGGFISLAIFIASFWVYGYFLKLLWGWE